MHRKELNIDEPCAVAWDEMHGDDQRRFCDHCTKHVHHLSGMTRRAAMRLLAERADDDICVRFLSNDVGMVHFEPKRIPARAPISQQRGVVRLLASAAALASLLTLSPGIAKAQSQGGASSRPPHQDVRGRIRIDPQPLPEDHEEVEGDAEEEMTEEELSAAEQAALDALGDIPCDPEMMDPSAHHDDPYVLTTMGQAVAMPPDAVRAQEDAAADQLSVFGIELEEEEVECDPEATDGCEPSVPIVVEEPNFQLDTGILAR